jgi:hypothetical protein
LRDLKAANHCYNERTENNNAEENCSKLDDMNHLLHDKNAVTASQEQSPAHYAETSGETNRKD